MTTKYKNVQEIPIGTKMSCNESVGGVVTAGAIVTKIETPLNDAISCCFRNRSGNHAFLTLEQLDDLPPKKIEDSPISKMEHGTRIAEYTHEEMERAFECGRNFQLTGENNFQELIEELKQKGEIK